MGLGSDLSEEESNSEVLHAVRGYLTDHFDDMATELRISLSYASQEHADDLLDRLLVHGEGAVVAGVGETLAARMSVEVSVVAPADLAVAANGLGSSPVLVTAMGLAQHPVNT